MPARQKVMTLNYVGSSGYRDASGFETPSEDSAVLGKKEGGAQTNNSEGLEDWSSAESDGARSYGYRPTRSLRMGPTIVAPS
jgi:hypothetical protein